MLHRLKYKWKLTIIKTKSWTLNIFEGASSTRAPSLFENLISNAIKCPRLYRIKAFIYLCPCNSFCSVIVWLLVLKIFKYMFYMAFSILPLLWPIQNNNSIAPIFKVNSTGIEFCTALVLSDRIGFYLIGRGYPWLVLV